MRQELNKSLTVGGVRIDTAIEKVEYELSKWQCSKYTHITRAIQILDAKVINLETIFSRPAQDCPVPAAVVFVYFHLDTATGALTYQFEEENVQHEVGGQSLAPGMYERWLDRIIGDKLQVRQLHDLATSFEQTRLVPPPTHIEEEVQGQSVDDKEAVGHKGITQDFQEDPGAKVAAEQDKLDLSTLLANIFDAADEENEFELRHKEVADLLYATPLSLTDWDIKLLLTTATEFETGRIEYTPFVQAAPEIIEGLRKRRAAFEERRGSEESPVTVEAIQLCFGEEIEEVARTMREAFGQYDPAGQGTLTRHEFRSCLMSKLERLSLQEVQMLMQMCREDEQGNVLHEEFAILLERLRIDALHNALVETDVAMLRMHLILLARRMGLPSDNIMPVWDLRNVLLSADQLCLSRMQIHVILSIVHPDEHGDVEFGYFLRVCCTVIPWMFDTAAFAEKAKMIEKEKAEAQAKQELEELQGLSSSLANKKRGMDEEDQEDAQPNAPDRDAVEKSLIHVGTQADDKHRNPPTLEVRRFLEAMKQEAEKNQLSEAELRGFVAEAEMDQRGEVPYVDHIKTWVPILFELRKSRIYDGILAKEWGPDEEELINLSSYEAQFPLHQTAEGEEEDRPASVASSASGKSARARQKKEKGGKASRTSSRSLQGSDSQSSLGSARSGAGAR
mmetsp:Transcript_3238/g.7651  ORF Transcript_3238/g.7651 Transcript_3238/m.7651 type:complete len:677 (+) Transcript_3238:66-2096(+)